MVSGSWLHFLVRTPSLHSITINTHVGRGRRIRVKLQLQKLKVYENILRFISLLTIFKSNNFYKIF